MRSLFVALLLLLLLSCPAIAQSTGTDLLSDCEQLLKNMHLEAGRVQLDNTQATARCWGYMNAIQQVEGVKRESAGAKKSVLNTCVPDNIKLTQLIRVVVSYGEQHPEMLHLPAFLLTVNAMQTAFPCQK
jgi:hypothetical protein